MYFNDDQTARVNALARQIEQHTGVRLTTALVDRSDSYPEIPWKSFAWAVCAHALLHLTQAFLHPDRVTTWSVQHTLGFVIGTSAAIALLAETWAPFGRLFLDRAHAEKRTHQYADHFFLNHELFRTPARTGVLLLVSIFERQVVLVPDSGLSGHLDHDTQQHVIEPMMRLLRCNAPFEAFTQGLARLEEILPVTGVEPPPEEKVPIAEGFIQLKCTHA